MLWPELSCYAIAIGYKNRNIMLTENCPEGIILWKGDAEDEAFFQLSCDLCFTCHLMPWGEDIHIHLEYLGVLERRSLQTFHDSTFVTS